MTRTFLSVSLDAPAIRLRLTDTCFIALARTVASFPSEMLPSWLSSCKGHGHDFDSIRVRIPMK